MEMSAVNTLFHKRQNQVTTVTYKSGGRSKQVDYNCCRPCNLKEISGCKVVTGECIQKTQDGGVDKDFGGEEDEEDKGRTEDKMVGGEKGRMWCGLQRGDERLWMVRECF